MYVSDAADATISAAFSKKTNNKIFNIGNGKNPISLRELAKIVKKVLKLKNAKIIFKKNFEKTDRTIEREIFYRYCDSSKFQKLIKWKPKITLEMGIEKILNIIMTRKINACVIGLGYVGLPLSIELSKYFKTIGLDISKSRIRNLLNKMIATI